MNVFSTKYLIIKNKSITFWIENLSSSPSSQLRNFTFLLCSWFPKPEVQANHGGVEWSGVGDVGQQQQHLLVLKPACLPVGLTSLSPLAQTGQPGPKVVCLLRRSYTYIHYTDPIEVHGVPQLVLYSWFNKFRA